MASHDEMIQAVRVRRNFQSNYGREFDHESWIYFAYGMTGEVIETGELIDSGYELDRAIAEAVCALGHVDYAAKWAMYVAEQIKGVKQ